MECVSRSDFRSEIRTVKSCLARLGASLDAGHMWVIPMVLATPPKGSKNRKPKVKFLIRRPFLHNIIKLGTETP